MKQIHWLASYPKSGSTWVRSLLEVYITGGDVDINSLFATNGDSVGYYHQLMSPVPLTELELYNWAITHVAALQAQAYMQDNKSDNPLILKSHNINGRLIDIPLYPGGLSGASVYLLRNPVDVAPSWARHLGLSIDEAIAIMTDHRYGSQYDPEHNAGHGFISSWDRHVLGGEHMPETLMVRYEDLKADPHKWFGEIVKQYGLEYDSARVAHAVELCEISKLSKQEDDKGFREASGNTKFFGATKERCNKKQVDRLKEAFSETMEKYGYIAAESEAA